MRVSKGHFRAGGECSVGKVPSCKCEDLGLNPQNPCTKVGFLHPRRWGKMCNQPPPAKSLRTKFTETVSRNKGGAWLRKNTQL